MTAFVEILPQNDSRVYCRYGFNHVTTYLVIVTSQCDKDFNFKFKMLSLLRKSRAILLISHAIVFSEPTKIVANVITFEM